MSEGQIERFDLHADDDRVWNAHHNPENHSAALVACAQHDLAEVQRLAALHSMLPDHVEEGDHE